MVRFEDDIYKNMTRAQKQRMLSKLEKSKSKKLEDAQFLIEMLDKYQQKIDSEKARL